MKNIIVVLALLLVIACSENKNTATQTSVKKDVDSIELSQQQINGVNIKFVPFSSRSIKPTIHANGMIKLLPESKAEVSSHIEGKVERIFVREGMYVKKGAVLLSISSFDLLELQNEYVSAKNDAEFQKADFDRQEALHKRKMGVVADYQLVKAKYQSAIIKEKTLKQKLEIIGINTAFFKDLSNPDVQKSINITAPFSGYVNKLNVHSGSLVEVNTILAEIIDNDKLEAEVYVYEKDVDMVSEGLNVKLSFVQAGIPNTHGKILYVSRALNPENKTITLHVQFEKPKGEQIHADMNVKALITGLSLVESKMALPATAIYDDGNAKYIFVTTNANAEKVAMKKFRVEIITEDDDYVVIKSIQKLPENCMIADNNVLAVEAERKKNE